MEPTRRDGPAVVWIAREAVRAFLADDCPAKAATIAFYALFSLAPLLVIVLRIAALAVDPTVVADFVVAQAGWLLGPEGADQIREIVATAARQDPLSRRAPVVGAVFVVIGATTVLVQLQRAFNQVWHVRPEPGLHLRRFLVKRAVSVVALVVIALLLVASLVASTVLAATSGWLASWLPPWLGTPSSTAIDLGVSVVVLAAAFSAMFKLLPDAEVTVRQVAVGGLVTSALYVAGKTLLGRYLGATAVTSLYGAAGSLAVVLVWVYYDALLVLFGAELTRAYARWRGERPRPEAHAVDEDEESAEPRGATPTAA